MIKFSGQIEDLDFFKKFLPTCRSWLAEGYLVLQRPIDGVEFVAFGRCMMCVQLKERHWLLHPSE